MPYDFKRAFIETISGVAIATLIQALFFIYIRHQQSYVTIIIIHMVNILLIIFLSFIIPFWSMSYNFGWTFGTFMLQSIGFIDVTEHILYLILIIPIIIRLIQGVT